jgi:hypothetical protein
MAVRFPQLTREERALRRTGAIWMALVCSFICVCVTLYGVWLAFGPRGVLITVGIGSGLLAVPFWRLWAALLED